MRLATFNIDNLDLPSRGEVPFGKRVAALRPLLERVAADILCLQEVNGQHVREAPERRLVALDLLLEGTRYAAYHRATTRGTNGRGVASVHNLVTLSRFPIREDREVRHQYVGPLRYRETGGKGEPVLFDRPLLLTDIELPGERHLDVVNLHLRAQRASLIPGEKVDSATWSTTSGWAEGYFISSLKRTGQALELRLLVDDILTREPGRMIAVAGDFNAEDDETPVRLARAGEEDTGNARLAPRALTVLDRAVPAPRRWSEVYHRRMFDHILASRALCERVLRVDVLNEELAAEEKAAGPEGVLATSCHAPVVADFDL